MRRLPCQALLALLPLFCVPFLAQPLFAQVFQNDGNTPDTSLGTNGVRRNRYSATGDVRNARTDQPLSRVQVTIRSDNGQNYFATLTDDEGRFSFDNLPRGSYVASVLILGYQLAEERVVIETGPAIGVQLRPRTIADGDASAENSGPAISAHELSASLRARQDMAKGVSLLYDKADFQGSIRAFQRAVKEFPDYYEAYAQLGMAYMELKDAANAEIALRKSLALSAGKYPQAYIYMSTLFCDNRRFAEAEPLARKALELDANSWQSYLGLSRSLVGLSRLPEAEAAVQSAVKLAPDQPELYLTLINIDAKLPRYRAMLTNIDAYLKLAPNGRAAEQVRAMRNQVQEALAKAQSDPSQTGQTGSDSKP